MVVPFYPNVDDEEERVEVMSQPLTDDVLPDPVEEDSIRVELGEMDIELREFRPQNELTDVELMEDFTIVEKQIAMTSTRRKSRCVYMGGYCSFFCMGPMLIFLVVIGILYIYTMFVKAGQPDVCLIHSQFTHRFQFECPEPFANCGFLCYNGASANCTNLDMCLNYKTGVEIIVGSSIPTIGIYFCVLITGFIIWRKVFGKK